ncbi:MAG: AAA family ATPase [Rubripirellula sp.]
MTKPSEADSDQGVDQKLDSLISRIQLLGGESKRAAQGAQPAPEGAVPADALAPGEQPEEVSGVGNEMGNVDPPIASVQARVAQARSVQHRSAPRQVRPVRSGRQVPGANLPDGFTPSSDEPWRPIEPVDLYRAGVNESLLEAVVYRFLHNVGEAEGREIADQVKLPFTMIEGLLARLKMEQHVAYKSTTATHDYVHVLTESGRKLARSHLRDSTYYGACPVPLRDYIASVRYQTIDGQRPRKVDLQHAFRDLLISPRMLAKIGPAVASGRGMFLFGAPGNGKTSIAERVTGAFGKYVWIPRAIDVAGEVLRIFDPMCHQIAMPDSGGGLLDDGSFDKRWVRIERPTIIAGGELTMDMLEVQCSPDTHISEAPLQVKSNCGILVIDDFGRQKMRVDELLNRWIVPLEKRYDFLTMASGKKIQVPFNQMVVFSTNLEPRDLVDDAFLRRIPYKIEAIDPTEDEFRTLLKVICKNMGVPYRVEAIDYLIETYYKAAGRPMRMCQPRDLLFQVKNYCLYNELEPELRNEYFDFACENYFSVM